MVRLVFYLWNFDFYKKLESPLIFILFLKWKQNKKENPKCDSLKKKNKSKKTWV